MTGRTPPISFLSLPGELTVEPANSDDAHRQLDKSHNLAASLSHVETRQERSDYPSRFGPGEAGK